MSPLELAKAFGASFLSHMGSNVPHNEMGECVGGQKVRYGEVEFVGGKSSGYRGSGGVETGKSSGSLGIGAVERTWHPVAGVAYGN